MPADRSPARSSTATGDPTAWRRSRRVISAPFPSSRHVSARKAPSPGCADGGIAPSGYGSGRGRRGGRRGRRGRMRREELAPLRKRHALEAPWGGGRGGCSYCAWPRENRGGRRMRRSQRRRFRRGTDDHDEVVGGSAQSARRHDQTFANGAGDRGRRASRVAPAILKERAGRAAVIMPADGRGLVGGVHSVIARAGAGAHGVHGASLATVGRRDDLERDRRGLGGCQNLVRRPGRRHGPLSVRGTPDSGRWGGQAPCAHSPGCRLRG